MAIGALFALVGGLLAATPAQAAPAPATSSAVATATPKALTSLNVTSLRWSDGWHWWGYSVNFNRTETRAIAAGAGSCSVVVGKLPALPAKILSAACGLLAVYAGWALSGGRCLAASVTWAGGFSLGRWNC